MVNTEDTDADGYLFANIRPSRIGGLVWMDFNDDGEVNFGEQAIEGVSVRSTGTDDRGAAVDRLMTTDGQGIFEFIDLRPSDAAGYTLTEHQPTEFVDGKDSLGTVNGTPTGVDTVDDVFSAIVLVEPGADAIDYNFGERPLAGSEVFAGQTATIGFWQNKNGQALIRSRNSSADSTRLGDWLSTLR